MTISQQHLALRPLNRALLRINIVLQYTLPAYAACYIALHGDLFQAVIFTLSLYLILRVAQRYSFNRKKHQVLTFITALMKLIRIGWRKW